MEENKRKKIIIIGAGVSGLSSGIYALKNGFDVELYEKNARPGGLCMAWKRRGFNIDGCVHWLTGTQDHTDLNRIWRDVGVIEDDKDIIYTKDAGVIEMDGLKVTLYCDINKLEKELLRVAPEDSKEIRRFCRYLLKIVNLPLPMDVPINTMNPFKLIKTGLILLPYLPFYLKVSSLSCEKYAQRFKSKIMKFLITEYQGGPGSLYPMLYSFGTVIFNNGGVPREGSQGMIDRMEEEYLSLGGKLFLGKGVKHFIIENKIAKGIVLEDGSIINGDYYVSATDGKHFLDKLLEGKYKNKELDDRFCNYKKYPSPSCYCCYFSIDKELLNRISDTHQLLFPINPIQVGDSVISTIKMRNYSYDKFFDHKNKTVIEVLLDQYNWNFDFWINLYKDKKKYFEEKTRINNLVREKIIEHCPGLKVEDLNIIDSFSPMTLNRYTNSYMGSFMSFMMTNKSRLLFHKGTIKGIKNVYFASQWGQSPGGLPLAALVGKFTIQRILKKENLNYKITPRLAYKYKR